MLGFLLVWLIVGFVGSILLFIFNVFMCKDGLTVGGLLLLVLFAVFGFFGCIFASVLVVSELPITFPKLGAVIGKVMDFRLIKAKRAE
jgi:hypothetical protein